MSALAPEPAKKPSAGSIFIELMIQLGLAFFLPQYVCGRASSFLTALGLLQLVV